MSSQSINDTHGANPAGIPIVGAAIGESEGLHYIKIYQIG